MIIFRLIQWMLLYLKQFWYHFFMIKKENDLEMTAILSNVPAEKAAIIESLLTGKNSKILDQESKILALEKEID